MAEQVASRVRMGGGRPLSLVSRRCSLGSAPRPRLRDGQVEKRQPPIPIAHTWALSATRSTKNCRCSLGLDCSPQASLGVRQRSCRFDPASLLVTSLPKTSCLARRPASWPAKGGSKLPHSKALRAAVPAVAARLGPTFSHLGFGESLFGYACRNVNLSTSSQPAS